MVKECIWDFRSSYFAGHGNNVQRKKLLIFKDKKKVRPRNLGFPPRSWYTTSCIRRRTSYREWRSIFHWTMLAFYCRFSFTIAFDLRSSPHPPLSRKRKIERKYPPREAATSILTATLPINNCFWHFRSHLTNGTVINADNKSSSLEEGGKKCELLSVQEFQNIKHENEKSSEGDRFIFLCRVKKKRKK